MRRESEDEMSVRFEVNDGFRVLATVVNGKGRPESVAIDVFDDAGKSVTTEIFAGLNREQAIELAAFLLDFAKRANPEARHG